MKHTAALFCTLFAAQTVVHASEHIIEKSSYNLIFFDNQTNQQHCNTVTSLILPISDPKLYTIIPDAMYADTGNISFNTADELCRIQPSRNRTNSIHMLCEKSANISTAEALLENFPQETAEQKLHHCIALIRLGEACLGLPYPGNFDRAYPYFHEAAEKYLCTGAMCELATITVLQNKNLIGLYWYTLAQKHGLEAEIDPLITYARSKCLKTEEGKKALEQWEAACKIKGLHHPEATILPSIHDID